MIRRRQLAADYAALRDRTEQERLALRHLITQHRQGNPDAITLMVALFGGEQQ